MHVHEVGPVSVDLRASFFAAALAAATFLPGPLEAATSGQVPDLSGSWVLNEEESDDVLRKLEEARQKRPGGGLRGGGRGDGLPPGGFPPRGGGNGHPGDARREGRREGFPAGAQGLLGALLARSMVIEQEKDVVVIKPQDVARGSERVLMVGAGKLEDILEGSVRRSVVADWKDGALVVKTKLRRERGSTRSIETWLLSGDGSGLIVTLETSGGPLQGIEIRRVYDRATSSAALVVSSPASPAAPSDALER